MEYNFDKIHDRSNTNSSKYDEGYAMCSRNDIDILSVADMDFMTAPCIINAINKKVSRGIFGYTSLKNDYFNSYVDWTYSHYGYKFKSECMVHTPGVISGLRMYIDNFFSKNSKFLILEPVYGSFRRIVENSGRTIVTSELINVEGKYYIDYTDFEKKIKNVDCFILCNPHNPLGIAWSEDDLKKIANICEKYSIQVISDEIHADLCLYNNIHNIFKKYYSNTVTFISMTKTFNLSGLQAAVCILPTIEDANKYKILWKNYDIYRPNAIAVEAIIEGINNGSDWLICLKKYIEGNLDFIEEYIKENIPSIKFTKPQATYLCWIDFRNLKMEDDVLIQFLIDKATIFVVKGSNFGESGRGFIRLNAACSRKKLIKILSKLKKAINTIK